MLPKNAVIRASSLWAYQYWGAFESFIVFSKENFLINDFGANLDSFKTGWAFKIFDQYSSILSCPVFDRGVKEIEIDLPDNKIGWYYEDRIVKGLIKVKSSLEDIPLYFVKAGSVVPMNEKEIHIYALENGEFEYKYYDDESIKNAYRLIQVNCKNKISVKGLKEDEKVVIHDSKNRQFVIL